MILQGCFSSTLVWRIILFLLRSSGMFFFYSFLLFYLFLLYSKAQLSTVADLRFLFALLQLPSVYLNSARQRRATYREYLVWCTCVHRRGVWMQCSLARVCVFEFDGEYKSFNICFFLTSKTICEYINFSNQSKWIRKLQMCSCVCF